MKKRLIALLLTTCLAFSATGCGGNKDLTKYKNEMDAFFADVEVIHNKINTINYESETAIDELLAYLDDLDKEFKSMAAIDVPKEFSSIESLADEASENMTLAVEKYHEAYSKDSYNEYTDATADEYYKRANKRFQYIIDILHGQMPEGDDITIEEEEE